MDTSTVFDMSTVIKKTGTNMVAAEESMGKVIVDLALSPLSMLTTTAEGSEQTFYSKKDIGFAMTGAFVGGAVVGQKYGDKIPLIRALDRA